MKINTIIIKLLKLTAIQTLNTQYKIGGLCLNKPYKAFGLAQEATAYYNWGIHSSHGKKQKENN